MAQCAVIQLIRLITVLVFVSLDKCSLSSHMGQLHWMWSFQGVQLSIDPTTSLYFLKDPVHSQRQTDLTLTQ